MVPVAKFVPAVVSFVAAAAVGKVVTEVVKSNTDPKSTLEKIQIVAGSTLLAAALGDITYRYTSASVVRIIADVKQFRASQTPS